MGRFAYNPITGKLDFDGAGGGGGGAVNSVNGGEYLDVVPVMETTTAAGVVTVYNNTWSTPYVVDQAITEGEKGTYSTIQSAIDDAFTNGDSTGGNIALIHIRAKGTSAVYTEDLSFPDGGSYYLYGIGSEITQTVATIRVAVIGNHTMTGTVNLNANSIYFLATGGGFAFEPVALQNLNFLNCAANFSIDGGAVNLMDCVGLGTTEILSTPGLGAWNSSFSAININDGGPVSFTSCNIGNITFTNSSGSSVFTKCILQGSITGTCTSSIENSPIFSYCQFSQGVTVTGACIFQSCSANVANSITEFYDDTTVDAGIGSVTRGNVYITRKTAIGYTLTIYNQYVGITDTSAPRTMTLPTAADGLVMGQCFVFKDESGTANVNNITIDGNGANIDGSPSLALITVAYGSVEIMWDGTQFWTV